MSAPKSILAALLLIALTVCAYWPALDGHAGFIWDDDAHITGNAALQDSPGLSRIWSWAPSALFNPSITPATPQYYPVTFTSFWLEYHAWDLNPQGYHITNMILHLAAAILLWIILHRLGVGPVVAWIAAALFAVHPVNVESVAWVTERKNTLSLLFFLAAALAYIRWARLDLPQPDRAASASPSIPSYGRAPLYILTLVLFLLALLSKSVTVTLPVALLLVTWWKRGRLNRKDLLAALPLLLIAVAMGLFTIYIEQRFVGAHGEDWQIASPARLLIAGRAPFFYLGKLLFPARLTFIYPRWDLATELAPNVWTNWLYPAGLVALLAVLFALRRWIGRGPLAAALFFLIMLFPALGFFNFYPMRYSFVADHFQYAASIGVFVLAAAAGARLHRLIDPADRVVALLAGVLTVAPLLAVLACISFVQCRIYEGNESLWRDTIAKNPRCWMAVENLGDILLQKPGEASLPEAITLYKKAIQFKPDHLKLKAYNELGLAYLQQHQRSTVDDVRQKGIADADNILNEALTLAMDADPASPEANANIAMIKTSLASVLMAKGQPDNAEYMLTQALELAPNYVSALIGRGNAYSGMRKYDQALVDFDRARELDPRNPLIYYDVGATHFSLGKPNLAERSFRQALKLSPRYADAWNGLGQVFHRKGGHDLEAVEAYWKAIECNPNLTYAYVNLGDAYMALHKEPEALLSYRSAIAIDPKFTIALGTLAEILATSDDPRVRSPNEAVGYALRANSLTGEKDVTLMELLAQAYSEAQLYDQAVQTEEHAIDRAAEQEKPMDLIHKMQQRHDHYVYLRTAYYNTHPDEAPPPQTLPAPPAQTLPATPPETPATFPFAPLVMPYGPATRHQP